MAKEKVCCVCGITITDNYVDYKRKKYCHECFSSSFDETTVDKHYCYLMFQRLFGRKPSDVEWTQMNKMVKGSTESSTEWTWRKVEYALYYVYEVEKFEPDSEFGVIGILPYYESKMMKFRNECFDIEDDVMEYGYGMSEPEVVIIKPLENEHETRKRKSIDSLIDWEEDDE